MKIRKYFKFYDNKTQNVLNAKADLRVKYYIYTHTIYTSMQMLEKNQK